MGASLWDQVWLPLLIGVAIQIIVAALYFLSIRLWNCLMKQIKARATVGESAQDQNFSAGGAATHANGMPDLETGNGHGPLEGGESMTDSEMELGLLNSGELGIEHFCEQEAHAPVIESSVTIPIAQVTSAAARGALAPVEMDVPHS